MERKEQSPGINPTLTAPQAVFLLLRKQMPQVFAEDCTDSLWSSAHEDCGSLLQTGGLFCPQIQPGIPSTGTLVGSEVGCSNHKPKSKGDIWKISENSHLSHTGSNTHLPFHSFKEKVQQLQTLGNFLLLSLHDGFFKCFQTLQIKLED